MARRGRRAHGRKSMRKGRGIVTPVMASSVRKARGGRKRY